LDLSVISPKRHILMPDGHITVSFKSESITTSTSNSLLVTMVVPSMTRYVCLLVLCNLSALTPVASFAPPGQGASALQKNVPAPIIQQPTPLPRGAGCLTVLRSSSRKTDHDYERTDDTDDIDEDAINELISERIQARKNGYYKRADVILDELYQKHGVMVQDHEKTWQAGGARRQVDPNKNNDDPYVQSGHSEADTLSSDDIAHIQDRLAQRVRAKKKRDFRAADAIREELREQFNVYIEDRKRAWSVGGNFGTDSSGRKAQNDLSYSKSAHSLDAKDLEEYILAQIEKRTAARKSRNYEESDEIREALKVEHNVHINDRLQEWSVGGDFGYN
jgi:hypothetical protein